MPDTPLLQVTGLNGGYGGKPVLQGVDFHVNEGEIVAIIGRNGVGKSTLMKTLIGLLPNQRGTVHLRGQQIDNLSAHRRARLGIGYVPQGRDVFPRMTVLENLLVGQSISGRKIDGMLEQVHGHFPILQERASQRAGTLSGGQQQQLAIGRVLMGGPSMVLLDEPSEGIQPNIVQGIARIMVDLNARTGLGVVFVEQNLDMIRAMAQRCYVMDKGRITASLTRADLDDQDRLRSYLSV
ncbi:ABC transporter ATP-binding protein [Paracoccus laeviglucosivorans]|uniref:Amino acid/amide ABC transporter ATP-binding protein 2, HAAT family n=1 Tax=Paracoccus laeviglucosivorans TaxID=1197861 RepID=A0A521FBW7_9RHOB|nr:ABC transporter ATP-binding protein [Paracoccus laeviglucosivorans]SMO93702.1 amino acid/amide ABC transporter ATP-binding protein 2, HAAT family [Paracoccus laeviglucosivorans]